MLSHHECHMSCKLNSTAHMAYFVALATTQHNTYEHNTCSVQEWHITWSSHKCSDALRTLSHRLRILQDIYLKHKFW